MVYRDNSPAIMVIGKISVAEDILSQLRMENNKNNMHSASNKNIYLNYIDGGYQ